MDHEFHSKTKFLTARTVDSSASEVESTDHFSDFLVALDDYNDTLEDNSSKRSKKLRIDMKYSKIFLKKILEKKFENSKNCRKLLFKQCRIIFMSFHKSR